MQYAQTIYPDILRVTWCGCGILLSASPAMYCIRFASSDSNRSLYGTKTIWSDDFALQALASSLISDCSEESRWTKQNATAGGSWLAITMMIFSLPDIIGCKMSNST